MQNSRQPSYLKNCSDKELDQLHSVRFGLKEESKKGIEKGILAKLGELCSIIGKIRLVSPIQ